MARGRGRSGSPRPGRSTSSGGRGFDNGNNSHGSSRGRGRGNSGRGPSPGVTRSRSGGSDGMAGLPPQRSGRGGGKGARGRGDATGGSGARGGRGGAERAGGSGSFGGGGGRRQPPPPPPLQSPLSRGYSGGQGLASASPYGRSGGTPGGKPGHGQDLPSLHGLANQFLFVELEKDGVWKVSVPNGQRFGKPFLAGLEAWARQVLGGEQPQLCKVLAPVPVPASNAAAGTGPGVTTPAAARSAPPNFIPPPPRASTPQLSGALGGSAVQSGAPIPAPSPPLTSLTGSGLPGLDTLGLTPGAAGAAGSKAPARRSMLPPPPPPPPATPAAGQGPTGAGSSSDTALDFVSLLQAHVGIAPTQPDTEMWGTGGGAAAGAHGGSRGGSKAEGSVKATAASLGEDRFISISREQGQGQEQGQEPDGAQPGQQGQAGEYRGLLAALDEATDAAEADAESQPDQQAEQGGEGETEESFYGDSEGQDDYEEEEEEEGEFEDGDDDEDEESYDDEGDGYFDDYEEEGVYATEEDISEEDFGCDVDEHDIVPASLGGTPSPQRPLPPPPPKPDAFPRASATAATPPPPPQRPQSGRVTSSPPLTMEMMSKFRSLDSESRRLRVSLRLERQLLNDTEVEMLASWYKERASTLLELSKLWLFDNRIGDRGAEAVARALLHPALLELHLSHNVIGDKGAAALLEALPAERPAGLRPLWLRLEWNIINVDLLQQRLEEQRQSRGLLSDVPQVQPASGGAATQAAPNLHEHKLVLGRAGSAAAVRLPWVACQKQPPSEAGVLREVKSFYARDKAGPASAVTPSRPAAAVTAGAVKAVAPGPPPPPPLPSSPPAPAGVLAPAAAAAAAPESQRAAAPPPPPLPAKLAEGKAEAPVALAATATAAGRAASNAAASVAAAPAGAGAGSYAPGPLLLFPDTSALISMLGGNTALLGAPGPSSASRGAAAGRSGGSSTARPPLDWSLLLSLAAQGRFGRSLPLNDQVFIVVADSVMKQLDGLKSFPETCAAVRRFMGEGLEQAGPAGYDFLTVLGAHEGEGLALAGEHGGMMGLAGSRSPWLASKGQAVDVRIVEVALYYQAEVTRAYQQGGGSRGASSADPAAAGEGVAANCSADAEAQRSFLPVILLSNDNAQISAAKSHGLPAFRLSSAGDLASQLQALAAGTAPLTSSVLRRFLAPQATTALGTTATRSLQDQFDCVIGSMRGVAAALKGVLPSLEKIHRLAAGGTDQPLPGQLRGVQQQEAQLQQQLQPESTEIQAEQSGKSQQQQGDKEQPCGNTEAALKAIRAILGQDMVRDGTPGAMETDAGLIPTVRAVLAGLQAELVTWEGFIRSHQAPSRLLHWAALAGPID